MIRVAIADLRDSWIAWLSVSLAFIATNGALALIAGYVSSGLAAIDSGLLTGDGESLVYGAGGINLVLVSLTGLAVIGAATGLVIGSRRAAVARLLLAGSSPSQVATLLSTQVAIVAVAGALIGDLVALPLVQPALDLVSRDRGFPHVPTSIDPGMVLTANLFCVGLCVIGGFRQSRAASRIPPVEALRASSAGAARAEGPVRRVLRGLRAVLVFGLIAAMFPAFAKIQPHLEAKDQLTTLMQLALLAVPLTGLGLASLLPWILAPMTRLWTAAIPGKSPSWHLARNTVIARSDRLVRSTTPVMFAVGLLFGLMCMSDTMVATLKLISDVKLEGTSTVTFLTFLGLALVVAISGSVGNIVMMSRQRSAELALDGIIGATPAQQILVPVLEGVIISVTASLLGLVMGLTGAGLIAYGLGIMLPAASLSVPWGILAVTSLICTVTVVLATTLPVQPSLRRPANAVIARLVAA